MSLDRRGWSALYLVLLLFTGWSYLHAIRPTHHWGGDFAVYLSQTRNVVEGAPFYSSTYLLTPASAQNHPAAYPPVTSLVMAPFYAVFGLDYWWLKVGLALFGWIALFVWMRVGCRIGLHPVESALATFVIATGSINYWLLDSIGSDEVNLLVTAVALLLILRLEQTKLSESRPLWAGALVAAALLVSIATRSTNFALVAGFGLHRLAEAVRTRRIPAYSVWSILLTGVGLVLYQTLLFNNASNYGNQFSLAPAMVARNAVFYLRSAAAIWSAGPTPLRYALAGITILGTIVGLIRKTWGPLEWYLVASYGMLCVYTSNDFRYTAPLLPILVLLAIGTLKALGQKFVPARTRAPLVAAGALALAGVAFNVNGIEQGPIPEGVSKPGFDAVIDYLRGTKADTMILSWNPRVFAFYTRHPSALYPQKAGEFERGLPAASKILLVKYEQPLDHEKLDAYLASTPHAVAYSNENFTVYRIR